MKRVFINTDFNRLQKVIGNIDNNLGIEKLSKENPVLFLNANGMFQIDQIDSNIILIKDELAQFNFTPFNLNENDFLLHHTKPEDFGAKEFEGRRQKGMHERFGPYYPEVFKKVIFNNQITVQNKAEEIIQILFPDSQKIMEAQLNILHNIYGGKSITDILLDGKSDYDLLKKDFGDSFSDFQVNLKGDIVYDNAKHIAALRTLRDAFFAPDNN